MGPALVVRLADGRLLGMHRTLTDLPIEAAAEAIAEAITAGSLVLTAEPGAGKSSVVPLIAAAVREGRVLVLEPRRLAARATAERLSQQLPDCGGVGDLVGLTIRGEHRVSERTRIEVVTEAILTARLQRDAELAGVGVVVFDEFHERNLHSDLGLAMAIESRATIRPDLAIVVMSATLDPVPVAELLDTENIIEVPGRTFPVETMHLGRPTSDRWAEAVAAAASKAAKEVDGDVLVFVPGRREIDLVIRRLSAHLAIGLHGGSKSEVQQSVLAPAVQQRIIVSTAVAETSVTLPGIEAVIDGGLLRRARFDPESGLGRLETVNATRFAADQRRGRAGRVGPGICYRLWSVEDERHLDDSVPPEIADGDPLPIAFELARWGDPEAQSLPLLTHPGVDRLQSGRRILERLGLLDEAGNLTPQGRLAGGLGVHPRIGSLLLTTQDRATPALRSDAFTVAALLDSDRWPSTPDVLAEIDRVRGELRRPADRLRQRLKRARQRPMATDADLIGADPIDDVAQLLAAAWPDRVAMQRTGRPGRYLLAAGREVVIRDGNSLVGNDFLVVLEADGSGPAATIRRAIGIDRAGALAACADAIEWVDSVFWDDRNDRIRAERQQRLGAIVLHAQPLADPSPDQVSAALEAGLRRRGLELLRWTDQANQLRQRLNWLHMSDPAWPAFDDQTLLTSLEQWLDLSRCRTPADVRRLRVNNQFLALLPWELRATLDDEAPTELTLPNGRLRRIDYSSGRPVLSIRLQHLFGLDEHPMIGPGAEPITIELLSPANRPAQVTTDLPGFWRGSYAAVRSDLRGRYPKHRWPEDPWLAEPGR